MKREIKFRAFCNVDCKEGDNITKMVYFSQLELDNGLWFNPDDENIHHINEWLTKPMQFTGLLDKNGIDIYEGDIVESFGGKYVDEKWVEVRHISVIEWWQSSSNLGYRLKNSKGKTMMIKPHALTSTMKANVIGNIHEHKHLLK